VISQAGSLQLADGRREVAKLLPGLFDENWQHSGLGGSGEVRGDVCRGVIGAPDGTKVDCELRWSRVDNGARLAYRLAPRAAVRLNSLHVSMDFPVDVVAGGGFVADGEQGAIPEQFGDVHLLSKPMESLDITLADGRKLSLRFASASQVLLQDNRRWGPSFSARMGRGSAGKAWPAGEAMELTFELTAEGGIGVECDVPVTIEAGTDWVALDVDLDIVPGSALDFSGMGFTDPPAGKHGWVIAREDGTFAFEEEPDTPRRFYGVNFCFGAQYVTHEQSDRIAERLQRLGYNSIRLHHYEGELVSPQTGLTSIAIDRRPNSTAELTSFEAPADQDDNYGSRIRGFLHPPETGDYTFQIASDDDGVLRLSTDESPTNKIDIASVTGWTGRREWDKYPTQKSKPVRLEGGRKYYVEALQKEGGGGDHVSVAWEGPGVVTGIIQGEHLSPFPDGDRGRIVREVWNDAARSDSVTPHPAKLEQLDYLVAALKRRGIYITTDLYVSRPVHAAEIWDGVEGAVSMNDFKMLVPVNERAWENWKTFTRMLLTHENPHTGLTWAEDPAVAWLCMINEGNFGNYPGGLGERATRDWQVAWNRWLAKTYGTRAALERAWGADAGGDPTEGTVPFHRNPYEDDPRGRDLSAFLAETERDTFARMKEFLRNEIGTKALLTNMNGWTNRLSTQAARAEYDYVDDHFYVDHPEFIDVHWQLPSRCGNTSPIAGGATGGRHCAFVRLLDKPFTISEYNYSGPGRFRGVGGIITGSMAALQGWGVVWRFAYSHSRDTMFRPGAVNYFDIVSDPLNQAAERASICLYLRGDMRPAVHTVAIAMTRDELLKDRRRNVNLAPGWHALALVTRVGTFVPERPGDVPADVILPLAWTTKRSSYRGGEVLDVDPYSGEAGDAALAALRRKGWLEGNLTDLGRSVIQSETGQLLIDAPRDVMVLDTPMTAGGYAPQGERIETGAATIKIKRTDATVWVSSVDGRPIGKSRRLIITHLTDLQNTGTRFAERARQTLLDWGKLPHLVRSGSAEVALKLDGAARAEVWALAASGRRVGEVEVEVRNGELVVPLDVRGPEGARMVYEVAVE
jgi:hypothetical protein